MASPRLSPLLIVALLAGGAGFGLAKWTTKASAVAAPTDAADDDRTVRLSAIDTSRLANAGGLASDLMIVRQVVREEITAALAAQPAAARDPGPVADDSVPAPALAPEHQRKLEQAQTSVAAALARGTWGHEDRDGLRAILSQLPPEMEQQVLGPLMVAVNQDKLKVAFFDGPPF
jgi:hypothetical protein